VVTDSVVWSNCMSNRDGGSSTGWASGLSAARDPINAVISNNVVYGNWGEGVSSYEADGTVIKNNEVYDNWSANIYVSDVTNILIQGNLVYQTGTMTSGSKVGIMMGDEKYNPPSSNIQVLDNIAYGNHRNYFWWQGTQGGGMNNVLIANNTFVNGTGNVNNGEGNVIIGKGTHINVRFMNNLVSQDSSLPVIATISQSGITYSNNLWSKTPYAAASGTGDVIGDPLLAKTDNPYSAEWYRLTELSPAIDKAKLLSAVTIDFFGLTRGDSPDIGAVEFTTITGGCE